MALYVVQQCAWGCLDIININFFIIIIININDIPGVPFRKT